MSAAYHLRNFDEATMCACTRVVQGVYGLCRKPATYVIEYQRIDKTVRICSSHAAAVTRTGSWDGARAADYVTMRRLTAALTVRS
jgi:hypothetical protein